MQIPDVYALLKEPKRLLTPEEVRAILHISKSTLRRWIDHLRRQFARLRMETCLLNPNWAPVSLSLAQMNK
jgi:hypothetical protein